MSRSCPCLDNNESFVLYQTDHKKNETKINVECTSHNISTIKHWKPTLFKCKKCNLIFSEYIDVGKLTYTAKIDIKEITKLRM